MNEIRLRALLAVTCSLGMWACSAHAPTSDGSNAAAQTDGELAPPPAPITGGPTQSMSGNQCDDGTFQPYCTDQALIYCDAGNIRSSNYDPSCPADTSNSGVCVPENCYYGCYDSTRCATADEGAPITDGGSCDNYCGSESGAPALFNCDGGFIQFCTDGSCLDEGYDCGY